MSIPKRLETWFAENWLGVILACGLLALATYPFFPGLSYALAAIVGVGIVNVWFDGLVGDPHRALERRVDALEKFSRSEFEKLSRVASRPLRRVYEFRIEFADQFWTQTVAATPEELTYVRQHGKRLVSLTLEVWRTHTIARVVVTRWSAKTRDLSLLPTDVQRLPVAERVRHLYPTSLPLVDDVVMWELPLGPAVHREPGPRLELRFEGNVLLLCAIYGRFGERTGLDRHDPEDRHILLRVSLGAADLEAYKRPDEPPDDDFDGYEADPSLMCYRHHEATRGFGWELWVHDLDPQ